MTSGRPLRHRDFRLLILGQTTSQFGAQISAVAIPLLAIVTLQATPWQVGLLTASGTIAFALIGLPAGAWIDNWRRRPILIAGDIARAALLATIPLAALLDLLTITQLVTVSLLAGFARVFFDVGYQSYLPSVVGKAELLAGNSAMETIRASGQVAGPGIGGWLVTLAGAANVVLIQAATFAVSAACLLAIRTPEPTVAPSTEQGSLRTRITDGLVFVWRTRLLRATALTSGAGNFAFAIASAVNFIFMIRTLHLSATAIGIVLALGSVTVMAGAALTPRLARRIGSARIVWLALAVTGPVALVGPLAQPGWSVSLIVVSTAAGELGQIIYAVTNVSLRQRLCPDRMLGRANATMRFLMMGLFPLGALLGGILGELLGPRPTLWIAGAIIALSPLPIYRALRGTRDVEDIPAWAEQV